jgi:hypothetical protein
MVTNSFSSYSPGEKQTNTALNNKELGFLQGLAKRDPQG